MLGKTVSGEGRTEGYLTVETRYALRTKGQNKCSILGRLVWLNSYISWCKKSRPWSQGRKTQSGRKKRTTYSPCKKETAMVYRLILGKKRHHHHHHLSRNKRGRKPLILYCTVQYCTIPWIWILVPIWGTATLYPFPRNTKFVSSSSVTQNRRG